MTKILFGAGLAVLAAAIPAAASAQRAPAASVVVVDMQRVYRDCTACKTAQAALQGQATALQTQAQTLGQPLQTEVASIEAAVRALNGKTPDAALQARITSLESRRASANQQLGTGEQNIRRNQAYVAQQINTQLNPIINEVMTARGANLAVDMDSTLASAAGLNVTDDVLARLNQRLPSVVTTAPAAPAPAPAAGTQPQGR